MGNYYEIIGVCRNNKEIDLKGYTCYGKNFGNFVIIIDLVSYNTMLQYMNK